MNEQTKKPIILIGMPGSGKTTLGKDLAQKMGYNFIDMDEYIESIAGSSIPALFKQGETVFRDWETRACRELAEKQASVIASGGGVVLREENIEILKKRGFIVFLNRPVEDIRSDIDYTSRPLLKDDPAKLYALFKQRYVLYQKAAHLEVACTGSYEQIIETIIREYQQICR